LIRFRISRAAQEDIDSILQYIAEDNSAASDRMLVRIVEALKLLGSMPGMGKARDDIRPGLRSYVLGPYVLYYRRIEVGIKVGIEVARLIHGSREPEWSGSESQE
jgi:toxin ParE1/3/4